MAGAPDLPWYNKPKREKYTTEYVYQIAIPKIYQLVEK
jgi:hypothetical protein